MPTPIKIIYKNEEFQLIKFILSKKLRGLYLKFLRYYSEHNNLLIINDCEEICELILKEINIQENNKSFYLNKPFEKGNVLNNILSYRRVLFWSKTTGLKFTEELINKLKLKIIEKNYIKTKYNLILCENILENEIFQKFNDEKISKIDMENFVYVAKNNVDLHYKIGKSVNVSKRMKALSSVPRKLGYGGFKSCKYMEVISWKSKNYHKMERDFHQILYSFNRKRLFPDSEYMEFFNVDIEKIKLVGEELLNIENKELTNIKDMIDFAINDENRQKLIREKIFPDLSISELESKISEKDIIIMQICKLQNLIIERERLISENKEKNMNNIHLILETDSDTKKHYKLLINFIKCNFECSKELKIKTDEFFKEFRLLTDNKMSDPNIISKMEKLGFKNHRIIDPDDVLRSTDTYFLGLKYIHTLSNIRIIKYKQKIKELMEFYEISENDLILARNSAEAGNIMNSEQNLDLD